MRVSIHQPNFIPWMPFFEKIKSVDIFIILTHCEYEKGGFQNRFQLGNEWFTMPVIKSSNKTLITDKYYLDPAANWKKLKEKLFSYHWELDRFDNCITDSLAETNVAIIRNIAKQLNIKTEIITDFPTELKGTDRLVELCEYAGATSYLSGISGKLYLELDKFRAAGIDVEFQEINDRKPILHVI